MRKKLLNVLSLALFLLCFSVNGQTKHFKKAVNAKQQNSLTIQPDYTTYSINIDQLMVDLSKAQVRGASNLRSSNFTLEIPNLKGKSESYIIQEFSVMAPELQAQYPQIRSYVGYGIDTPSSYLRFTISPYKGLSGIILSGEEGKTMVLEPSRTDVSKVSILKKEQSYSLAKEFECTTPDDFDMSLDNLGQNSRTSADGILHTFDLAMSVTGEYSQFHGGTLPQVNAAIANTLTTVNAVFENDFNVNMVLIANNDDVVFLDPASDPYSGTSDGAYNTVLRSTLNSNIGVSNYDIGHLMAGIGNNGNAGCIGCICEWNKGSGFTTSTSPVGVNFDIDFVAHEMGHQFGANHTFTIRNEGTNAHMEPGSGSTIMGYAGITGATDVQSNSDPYFHAFSIQQVITHVSTRDCDVETDTGNSVPTANAGTNLTLPKGTPFRLTGSGSDADAGDTLTYCWEQFDENDALNPFPSATSTNSNEPLFRSSIPTTNPTRTFPKLSDLVSLGFNGGLWEKVPTVARSADFRLTVRDNKAGGGANSYDDMTVTWTDAAGPFIVTSQNETGISWNTGETKTITWDVANTTGAGINVSNVNILLSTDGGVTFGTVLASNVPNNGAYDVSVPDVVAPFCRVMVEAVGHSFFNINEKHFSINATVEEVCNSYESGPIALAIPDGAFGGGQGAPVFHSINVTENVTIGDETTIKFNVDVSHPELGEVLVQIQHPDVQTNNAFVNVWVGNCGGNSNFDITFIDGAPPIVCGDNITGTFTPDETLGVFNGLSTAGDWYIAAVDFAAGNTGTINDWSIEICSTVLSTEDYTLENSFAIYPNPNNGEFNVKFNSTSDNVSIEVFDIRGRSVYTKGFNNAGTFNETINLGNVQAGMYLLNVNDGYRTFTKKIIVE
ncbi:putative secreted protein (Por secretion system target) [Oceanihabitans sediminis]|uniref:T9SS C-terminal target domain-containing protein n=1 Tax=Oceanihabitans sediminis TaxID=1812012 RepID=A0A368P6E5_9FLAO|nr:zinc-dependent metalloprotease [Oceanihabitans sediminis]RBP34741.1 putative secreted protein (Por secretion system target) [Oceanihabitans sediminis]RCU58392.1 T9SS C-terminal target domain-containing protein [Oceanihabitans sediminis]